jgi:hypothetical protein
MKIKFALLCLGVSGALARALTTAELVQDKPDRLYVAGDTLSASSYSDNVVSDSGGGVAEGQVWHQDFYSWLDGVGGSGWIQDAQQSDDWNSSGFLWGWTNRTSSQMTWGTNGSGMQIYTANDGSTATYDIGLPLLTSEHCVVKDPQSPPVTLQNLGGGNWVTNWVQEQYVRHSQTRWRLQTGGRANRSSLFRLSATAAQILDKRAQRPFYNVNSLAIPPQGISVMGQALYADGNLWMVLPDGANLDVTPYVNGQDFCTTAVAEQKYMPDITVNNLSLNENTPEFCAGQHLGLQLAFDPLPETVDQVSLWNLPGTPVNESWRDNPNGSVNYRFDANLLTNLATSCWYSSGNGGKAMCATSLQFSNGQFCVLVVRGNFSVFVPSFSGFYCDPSLIGFNWSSPDLQAQMQWQATVQSAYDGVVGVTQLISGTNAYCNCGGDFFLDGTNEIYGATGNPPGQTYAAADPATHLARFTDFRATVANPTANLTATFEDFLRFRPAGSQSNIWVTLATNSWSMDGLTSLSGGLIRSNLAPASVLIQSHDSPAWKNQHAP